MPNANAGDWQRTCCSISIPKGAASGLFDPTNAGSNKHGRHFFALFGLFFYYRGECDTSQEEYNMSYQALASIGFGILYPMHRCGNYVIVVEAFTSILLLPAIGGGLIFSKFSIPKISVVFSRVAVITPDYVNGQPAIVIRCTNPTHSTQVNKDVLLDVSFEAELHRTEKLWTSTWSVLHVAMQGVDSSQHLTICDQHMYIPDDIESWSRFKPIVETKPGTFIMQFDLLDAIKNTPMTRNNLIKPTWSFHQGLYVMPGLADHISPYELSFFLSIHTMSTIGYGNIGPSENDIYRNGVVAAEAIIGLTFSAISLVFVDPNLPNLQRMSNS
ncbi:hypothetical protein THRCLA_04223 [Thraustotheca clavata]|uniref:Uncharacterized protein n=1 Tax=Thraustotheca clavata TaxID=74557 RepID=A0A1V9ZZK9_9STRA|nr:hypothetical protein THRCLA_04223 [Thraustotheca clavata]